MKVQIISAKKTIFEREEINCISLNTTSGFISVYPGHKELISRIDDGVILITGSEEESYFAAIDGLVYISNDNIKILVGNAISAEEIDEQASLKAREEAEIMLRNTNLEATEIAFLEAIVRRENTKINIARLSRGR